MPDGDRSNNKNLNLFKKLFSFFKVKKHNCFTGNSEQALKENDSYSHYRKFKAEDIMIPRIDIIGIEYTNSIDDICKTFISTRHTRMPVYKGDLDSIIGFINIKDVFPFIWDDKFKKNFEIDKIIRQLLIVSPSMKILDLLEEMKKTRTHIAMVVDELGGIDGLITIEDLIEEIVGEIEDEYDQKEPDLSEIKPNIFQTSGRTKIEVIAERLNINFDPKELEEYNTIGGLILSISGNVPSKGRKIYHAASNLVFEIVDSDPRRIKEVLISRSN